MKEESDAPNVRQAVPLFEVENIEASLKFYVDGLGFTLQKKWVPESRIEWCWLELGQAAIMLQEFGKEGRPGGAPNGPLAPGVTLYFICTDALSIYHHALSHGLKSSRPFVGNAMWVTFLTDPDGYRLGFESPTDVPEDTVYSEDSED